MKISTKHTVVILWILFVVTLAIGLELFARYKFGYHISLIKLEKTAYFEHDKLKIYNRNFVEEKKVYFKNWPIPLETFQDEDSTPRYLFKPNLKMARIDGKLVPANQDDEIFWSSNPWGFRGKEFPVEKNKGKIRIVALGASTTEGSQFDYQTYPFYLENQLISKGLNVEVINAGHHGHGIDDLLALFQQRVVPLKPDVVIFYEASNNINPYEWLRENWLGWHSWDAGYGKIFRFFHQRSAVFVFLTKQLGFEEKRPPVIEHTFDTSKDKPTRDNFERKVKEIVKIARENEIEPILTTFITVASKNFDVDRNQNKNLWEELYFKWYPFTPGEIAEIYDSFNQRLKKIAQDEDVLLIDLSSRFPKDQKYFIDHVHFTPEGSKLLANLITEELEEKVLNEDSPFAN